MADFSVWKAFLGSKDAASAKLCVPRISGGLFGTGVGIGLQKEDTALATKFGDAIKTINTDGTLTTITFKWFGADMVTQ